MGCSRTHFFAGNLQDSKPTSVELCVYLEKQTFVSISWTCKKQTAVSDISEEPETFSWDGGLRMEGIPALHLWDCALERRHFHILMLGATQSCSLC